MFPIKICAIKNYFYKIIILLGSGSTDIFLTRKFLYQKLNESGQSKLDDQVLFLKKYLEKRTNCPESKKSELHKNI